MREPWLYFLRRENRAVYADCVVALLLRCFRTAFRFDFMRFCTELRRARAVLRFDCVEWCRIST
jgi:hypothetical protein